MLDKRFVKANIQETAEGVWVLTIRYNYYALYEYDEVYVLESLELAKNKLLRERTHGDLLIMNASGNQLNR